MYVATCLVTLDLILVYIHCDTPAIQPEIGGALLYPNSR